MIMKMEQGDLDKMIAEDERHKLSCFNDVPDDYKMQPQVHEILREIGMLPMSAVSTCYFEGLDAIAASSITRQENMVKVEGNPMAHSCCVPPEVEFNRRSLLHRCRAIAHGKTETGNDLLTTFAGNPVGLGAEPTCNASNSTQLGHETPSGCALFQGFVGGESGPPRQSTRRRGRHG